MPCAGGRCSSWRKRNKGKDLEVEWTGSVQRAGKMPMWLACGEGDGGWGEQRPGSRNNYEGSSTNISKEAKWLCVPWGRVKFSSPRCFLSSATIWILKDRTLNAEISKLSLSWVVQTNPERWVTGILALRMMDLQLKELDRSLVTFKWFC